MYIYIYRWESLGKHGFKMGMKDWEKLILSPLTLLRVLFFGGGWYNILFLAHTGPLRLRRFFWFKPLVVSLILLAFYQIKKRLS
jgi:hypothetical protein